MIYAIVHHQLESFFVPIFSKIVQPAQLYCLAMQTTAARMGVTLALQAQSGAETFFENQIIIKQSKIMLQYADGNFLCMCALHKILVRLTTIKI